MQTNKISKDILIAAALALTLAACQSGSSGTSGYSATSPAASGSCSADSQAKLIKATDILFSRGFGTGFTLGFVKTSAYAMNCEFRGPWLDHFKKKSGGGGVSEDGWFIEETKYDITSGRAYNFKDPATTASLLPSCFRKGSPQSDCRPIYHPQMGCKLDTRWKKFCRLQESGDGCWSGGKADIVIAPPSRSAQMSRIQLASATRLDSGPAAKPSKTTKARRAPASSVKMCAPLDKGIVKRLGL